MPITVDCGEGKHDLCTGTGRTAYLISQESRGYDEPPFYCGCHCHHDGSGTPCGDPECPTNREVNPIGWVKRYTANDIKSVTDYMAGLENLDEPGRPLFGPWEEP